METLTIHYYDVIHGKPKCGASVGLEAKDFSVFPEQVNCPECLKEMQAVGEGKSEAN